MVSSLIPSGSATREKSARVAPDPRLHGRWLTLAHVGWGLVIVIELALFLPGVPLYYRMVHIPCNNAARGACNPGQLSASGLHALQHLGIAPDVYAALVLAVVLGTSLVFFTTGGLIAWRRWDEGMGLFVSLVLITLGATGVSDTLLSAWGMLQPGSNLLLQGLIGLLITGIIFLQWPAFGAFLLSFPTGRFTPGWSWLLIGLWVMVEIAFNVKAPSPVILGAIALTLSGTLGVQVYRYRQVYRNVERQQTKWLVLSMTAAVVAGALLTVVEALAPGPGVSSSLFQAANLVLIVIYFLPLALAIGIAILRYRLYDIDIIINRALVYGSLTATLAAIYFGTVVGVQAVVRGVTGQSQQPPVLVVASTLLIAALFDPLRRRIQAFIDRRFYRRKYDAARTLESFSATLRGEVDLERLSDQLVAVVEETMQPAHVSLWLRPPEQQREPR